MSRDDRPGNRDDWRHDQDDGLSDFAAMLARGRTQYAGAPVAPQDPAEAAAARSRRRRRRLVSSIVGLVVVALIGGYVVATLSLPAGGATVDVALAKVEPPAAAALSLPATGESEVSVTGTGDFQSTTGTKEIVASAGGTGPLPIASISKLVTALVILQAKPLGVGEAGPTITFDKADHALYDKYYVQQASIEPMDTGSVMSERDALETILVASACNYAEAVSTWAYGSQAAFLSATKKWLTAHGLTSTRLVEPTGVDARNVSTPADLLALGRLAMANPVVAAMVRLPSVAVGSIGPIAATNDLLGVDGVNGIKTGTLVTTDLLFSAEVPVGLAFPVTVIGVVLGGDSRASVDADVRRLIASLESGFHDVPLIKRGQVFGRYTTPWGDDATVVAGTAASVFTWSSTPITSAITTKPVTTASDGTTVGRVRFAAGTSAVSVPLLLKGTIAGPDAWWRLTHPAAILGGHPAS
ncbi:MAG TPA: D-alanyl-D-alanine carboxypeptidase [Lacisediminihabitans sp.]|uniref:D-alanyl-D-alanine carboxypeptidase family protein n=1 Tax=Lacisediminihabitans sp. TaxID=2787631 RepID=UPI002ED929EE